MVRDENRKQKNRGISQVETMGLGMQNDKEQNISSRLIISYLPFRSGISCHFLMEAASNHNNRLGPSVVTCSQRTLDFFFIAFASVYRTIFM